MNKIFNWTFGSIFRTLGRIIAYIIIGIIAVMIFNAGGFKKPKISNILNDVLFMKVDALTMDGVSQGEIGLGSSQRVMFIDNDDSSDTWDFNNFNSGSNDYLVIPINGFSGYVNHVEVNQDNYNVELVSNYVMFYILSDINYGNQACEIQNNMIVCPLIHNIEYSRLYVEFWSGGNPGGSPQSAFDIRFKLYNYPTLYKTQTNAIIENQNQNTQATIENQNANTNATIENQNQNTQQQIESQQVCKQYDKTNVLIPGYLNINTGGISQGSNAFTSDYINITQAKIIVKTSYNVMPICWYDSEKTKISCSSNQVTEVTPPTNATYFRFSITYNQNKPIFEICQNGNQAMANTITDSNVSEANSSAGGFFNNFSTTDNGGLSSIITAPLSAIQSLTSASCSPLVLPLPFINENLTLPCMRTIYDTHFGAFMVLYDTITIGIISYWILVRIFNMVKDFKNPDHDEIEVVDL